MSSADNENGLEPGEITWINESQADSSYNEDVEPKQVITVIADVHAEMNANVPESRSAVSPTESQSNSTMAKMAETKRLLPTPEQKRLYDEIFAIEDNVDWKTVSNNLHQYRIETIEKSTAATVAGKPKETSRFLWTGYPKRLFRQVSYERSHNENHKPMIGDAESNANQLDADTNQKSLRKRKASVGSDSDESTDHNNCKRPAIDSEYYGPNGLYTKNFNVLNKTMSQSEPLPSEPNQFDVFDKIVHGTKFQMGSEIDSSDNITLPNVRKCYSRNHLNETAKSPIAYMSSSDSD